ncbi:MAG: OsmC family protein [Pseudomonadota bacterium]|nr:OsmC family protein [Pseudomonadota bacterium]
MSENNQFSISLELVEDYLFKIDFGDFGDVLTDEPPPLGSGEGPNPSRLVAAAVGNCLCASLLFALRKHNDSPGQIRATVQGELERQDGRWRIGKLDVVMQVENPNSLPNLPQALATFEDFCVVTQSIRSGIPVQVTVQDTQGNALN